MLVLSFRGIGFGFPKPWTTHAAKPINLVETKGRRQGRVGRGLFNVHAVPCKSAEICYGRRYPASIKIPSHERATIIICTLHYYPLPSLPPYCVDVAMFYTASSGNGAGVRARASLHLLCHASSTDDKEALESIAQSMAKRLQRGAIPGACATRSDTPGLGICHAEERWEVAKI